MTAIDWVGFDADDTLWRSEDYYRQAQADFERILADYIDLPTLGAELHAVEGRNLALFGYGAKGMTLSMLETAIQVTDARISANDLQRIVELGKTILQHPVELLPDVRDAVLAIAAEHPVVLITKGDLFHQEQKTRSVAGAVNDDKPLTYKDFGAKWRRSRRRSCGPVRPDVVHSCPDFAPIMEAA